MKKELTRVAQRDFLAFAKMVLRELDGTVIDNDPYIELLATDLMDFADGSTKRLLINMPPRHGKTKLASICCSAWILGHEPSAKIMVITYSKDLSENIARSIRNILQSDVFKKIFATRIEKGHAKSTDFATTAGGRLYATSFDGAVTGFGGDIIIVDDPHNIADAGYPDQLESTIEKFHSMVVRRLDNRKKGRIMVVGHRIHEHDLSADLLAGGGWTHLALPIDAPRDQSYRTACGWWHRRKGELLRPDADDVDDIERLRRKLVNPSFELLYQQDVEGQSLPALTAEHFPSYDGEDIANLPRFISIDPGTDEGDGRSFSVIQLWASDGATYYLLDQIRERCDFSDLMQFTKRFAGNNRRPDPNRKDGERAGASSALSEATTATGRADNTARFQKHSFSEALRKASGGPDTNSQRRPVQGGVRRRNDSIPTWPS